MTEIVTLEDALAEIETLRVALSEAKGEIDVLRKWLFKRGRDKVDPNQLGLFDELLLKILGPETPESDAKPEKGKADSKKKGHGRALFPESLPRKVVVLDLTEAERICPCCGKAMQRIGEDVCERGHYVPGRVEVHRYERPKYACPDGHGVVSHPAPPGVVEGAKFEPSVYSFIVVSKYGDHLPLHRLEGILARSGVHLPKQTMWEMLLQVDGLLAQPILTEMKRELLLEPVVQADETRFRARLENGKGSATCWAWAWRSVRDAGTAKVVVEFCETRSGDEPIQFLGDWSGVLVTDGYAGFEPVATKNGITRAGCMPHARRKLVDALEQRRRDAGHMLHMIDRLFALERAIKNRAARQELDWDGLVALRLLVRRRTAARRMERIFARAELLMQMRSTTPKSRLGVALGYLLNQRVPLSVFLEDGRVPMHNNDTERDLRHLVVGRGNWQLFGSKRGGAVGCRLYSLVLSCRAAGVNPEEYIADVLVRIQTTPPADYAQLTPWAWAAARRAQVAA